MNIHPIDWYNFYGSFKDIFSSKGFNLITDNDAAVLDSEYPNRATFKYIPHTVDVLQNNSFGFNKGSKISLFQLLTAVKFKHDVNHAISYVMFDLMGLEVPYIRVGTDYYKVIKKIDRYGGKQTHLKPWGKEEIKQDHSKTFISQIPKYDDFIIVPDNKNYSPVIDNCYNLYSEFSHKPYEGEVTLNDVQTSIKFLNHIFGDQFELGLKYIKILYENPKQILPILTLVSKERDTGKTTFINWFEMIFGANSILISPEDILKHFNANYATKNIVLVDETFVEKQSGVEKLKSLSTAKSINVSQKHVSEYQIPLYMKVVLCTNKVKDFMRIDSDEIRFWIRSIPTIKGKKNVNIERDLFNEIPKFLKLLQDLPDINFDTGSRMVFTKEEIETNALIDVKEESKSWLHKELEIRLQDYFDETGQRSFMATATEIHFKWFANNKQVSIPWLKKVIMEDMNYPLLPKQRYRPFNEPDYLKSRVSRPFEFICKDVDGFIDLPNDIKQSDDIPF